MLEGLHRTGIWYSGWLLFVIDNISSGLVLPITASKEAIINRHSFRQTKAALPYTGKRLSITNTNNAVILLIRPPGRKFCETFIDIYGFIFISEIAFDSVAGEMTAILSRWLQCVKCFRAKDPALDEVRCHVYPSSFSHWHYGNKAISSNASLMNMSKYSDYSYGQLYYTRKINLRFNWLCLSYQLLCSLLCF